MITIHYAIRVPMSKDMYSLHVSNIGQLKFNRQFRHFLEIYRYYLFGVIGKISLHGFLCTSPFVDGWIDSCLIDLLVSMLIGASKKAWLLRLIIESIQYDELIAEGICNICFTMFRTIYFRKFIAPKFWFNATTSCITDDPCKLLLIKCSQSIQAYSRASGSGFNN